jgi:pimeloyl-ACP methyl ester carboxylesterase
MTALAELHYLTANGIRFAYHQLGPQDGPLVLCLHGFPDSAQSYAQLLPQLAAAGYRAVAPYMRGYAPTGLAPDGDYSTTALGQDVLALIDALGANNAAVIGHDWGAYAAYCAANLDASRIRKLVLMSVPHIGGAVQSLRQLRRSWYIWFFQLSGLPERRVARDNYAFIDQLYRVWSPTWPVTENDLRPVKQALAAPGGLAAAIGYYRAMFRGSSRASWALLSAKTTPPTLMLSGAIDGAVGAEVFGRSQEAFSGPFEFQLLPDIGHFPQREAPEDVGKRILAFLGRDA